MQDRWHRSNVHLARTLRERETASERMLWTRLRRRGLDGYKFRRQHPIGPWVVDFYCPDLRLVVEIDGPIHGQQAEDDLTRQSAIEEFGIRFVRMPAHLVEHDLEAALSLLRGELRDLSQTYRAGGSPASLSRRSGRGPG